MILKRKIEGEPIPENDGLREIATDPKEYFEIDDERVHPALVIEKAAYFSSIPPKTARGLKIQLGYLETVTTLNQLQSELRSQKAKKQLCNKFSKLGRMRRELG